MFKDFFKHFGDPMSRFRDSGKVKSNKKECFYPEDDDVNTATGLPMLGGMDVAGNGYGTGADNSRFDAD